MRDHVEAKTCAKANNPCPVCRKKFSWQKDMMDHLRERHPEQAPAKKSHRLAHVEGRYELIQRNENKLI